MQFFKVEVTSLARKPFHRLKSEGAFPKLLIKKRRHCSEMLAIFQFGDPAVLPRIYIA
jgi:hypothetical protein